MDSDVVGRKRWPEPPHVYGLHLRGPREVVIGWGDYSMYYAHTTDTHEGHLSVPLFLYCPKIN